MTTGQMVWLIIGEAIILFAMCNATFGDGLKGVLDRRCGRVVSFRTAFVACSVALAICVTLWPVVIVLTLLHGDDND